MTFSVRFDDATGRMTSPPATARSWSQTGPALNLWRAATDNDANTWGDQRVGHPLARGRPDQLEEHVDGVEVSQPRPQEVVISVRTATMADVDEDALRARRWQTLTDGIKMMLVHRTDEEQRQMLAPALGFNYADLAGQRPSHKAALIGRCAGRRLAASRVARSDEGCARRPMGADIPEPIKTNLVKQFAETRRELSATAGPIASARFDTEYPYTSTPAATSSMHHVVPSGTLPPLLPRVGLTLALPAGYETFTWYGRGPHENYADRKSSAPLGRYSGSVDEQLYPYVIPQESGNKTDVCWAASPMRTGSACWCWAIGSMSTPPTTPPST